MTVSTEVSRVIVEGNSVATSFAYSFPIPGSTATDQTNAELILLGTDSSITVLADNLWSMTGVGTAVGGTFVYNPGSPLTTGAFLVLNRIVPYLQPTELTAQGAYSPAVVMAALDNLAFQTEQLNTWRLQSIRAPITDAALSDLPTADLRANSFLYFDDNGDVTTASSTGGMPSSILVGNTASTTVFRTQTLILPGATLTSSGSETTASFVLSGGTFTVTDGTHTASNASILKFTSNATVTNSTGSTASVAITGGGGGGAMVFISSNTLDTGLDRLNITTGIDDTYDNYQIEILDVYAQTDGAQVNVLLSTNSGVTWISSGYGWVDAGMIPHASPTNVVAQGGNGLSIISLYGGSFSALSNLPSNTVHGTLKLRGFRNPAGYKMIGIYTETYGQDAQPELVIGAGSLATTTVINGIQFLLNTGNWGGGVIRLYGIAKS